MHESLKNSQSVKIGSERSFGLVFAGVFLAFAAYSYFIKESSNAIYLASISLAFLVLAVSAPKVLKPLNLAWFKVGQLLHKIVNPLVMGFIFFVTITPIGLIMRARGKDLLRLKKQGGAESYWIKRTPPGPAPDSLKKQF
jgi:large-conductance mechanosensitive channel